MFDDSEGYPILSPLINFTLDLHLMLNPQFWWFSTYSIYTHLAQKGAPHMMRQEWWKSFRPPIHHYVELQVGYNHWYKPLVI